MQSSPSNAPPPPNSPPQHSAIVSKLRSSLSQPETCFTRTHLTNRARPFDSFETRPEKASNETLSRPETRESTKSFVTDTEDLLGQLSIRPPPPTQPAQPIDCTRVSNGRMRLLQEYGSPRLFQSLDSSDLSNQHSRSPARQARAITPTMISPLHSLHDTSRSEGKQSNPRERPPKHGGSESRRFSLPNLKIDYVPINDDSSSPFVATGNQNVSTRTSACSIETEFLPSTQVGNSHSISYLPQTAVAWIDSEREAQLNTPLPIQSQNKQISQLVESRDVDVLSLQHSEEEDLTETRFYKPRIFPRKHNGLSSSSESSHDSLEKLHRERYACVLDHPTDLQPAIELPMRKTAPRDSFLVNPIEDHTQETKTPSHFSQTAEISGENHSSQRVCLPQAKHELKSFLQQPLKIEDGLLCCRVARVKNRHAMGPPTFILTIDTRNNENSCRILLYARKRSQSQSTNFIISMNEDDLSRSKSQRSPWYLAKLRRNEDKTRRFYALYDTKANFNVAHKIVNQQSEVSPNTRLDSEFGSAKRHNKARRATFSSSPSRKLSVSRFRDVVSNLKGQEPLKSQDRDDDKFPGLRHESGLPISLMTRIKDQQLSNELVALDMRAEAKSSERTSSGSNLGPKSDSKNFIENQDLFLDNGHELTEAESRFLRSLRRELCVIMLDPAPNPSRGVHATPKISLPFHRKHNEPSLDIMDVALPTPCPHAHIHNSTQILPLQLRAHNRHEEHQTKMEHQECFCTSCSSRHNHPDNCSCVDAMAAWKPIRSDESMSNWIDKIRFRGAQNVMVADHLTCLTLQAMESSNPSYECFLPSHSNARLIWADPTDIHMLSRLRKNRPNSGSSQSVETQEQDPVFKDNAQLVKQSTLPLEHTAFSSMQSTPFESTELARPSNGEINVQEDSAQPYRLTVDAYTLSPRITPLSSATSASEVSKSDSSTSSSSSSGSLHIEDIPTSSSHRPLLSRVRHTRDSPFGIHHNVGHYSHILSREGEVFRQGVLFQFGMLRENVFALDFSFPLSPVQAFAIALARLDSC